MANWSGLGHPDPANLAQGLHSQTSPDAKEKLAPLVKELQQHLEEAKCEAQEISTKRKRLDEEGNAAATSAPPPTGTADSVKGSTKDVSQGAKPDEIKAAQGIKTPVEGEQVSQSKAAQVAEKAAADKEELIRQTRADKEASKGAKAKAKSSG